jgi:hypothetical protein
MVHGCTESAMLTRLIPGLSGFYPLKSGVIDERQAIARFVPQSIARINRRRLAAEEGMRAIANAEK